MSKLVKIEAPELAQIDKSEAAQIRQTFEPMVAMLEEFEGRYNEIASVKDIDEELCKRAKKLRLDIAKVRIETGKAKDEAKKYLKLKDRAIMGVHNILVHAVTEKEDRLKKN